MSFALNTLRDLLASKTVGTTANNLGIVLATGSSVIVSTNKGAITATPQGIMGVGDRVNVEGSNAYPISAITTIISV